MKRLGLRLISSARLSSTVFCLGVLLAGLGGLGPPLYAQQPDSTELRRFRMADSFLQSGETEKAIKLLESLYQQSPDNASFYRKLKDAYESVKRYDEAMELVQDRIDENPTPQLLSEKARLLHQADDREAAEKMWADAIALAPDRPATYRIVYQTLVDVRRFSHAIEVLQQARTQRDDDTLFRTELAHLYSLDGQHRKAMREYVSLLDESPDRMALVRSRLQRVVDRDEGTSAIAEVLEEAVENNPLNAAYRELLAWLYMKTDDYEGAYDVYRALDRLQQNEGRTLYSFAQKAADADAFDVAATAFEAILERHPDAEVAADARRALGNTYRRWAESGEGAAASPDSSARYDAARASYEQFLEQHPDDDAYPDVLYELGALQLDVERDLDAAEASLEEVVSTYPDTDAANEARYDLGRIALLRGTLDDARLRFSRLAERLRSGDLADRARFELALLQFYQGRFDAARGQAQATSANTAANVTNDAIELSVLIQENRGPDSLDTALRQYARARLDVRRHRHEEAVARLDSLLQTHGRHSLADDARFRRAEVQLARGDTAAALESFREIPDRHARSSYADRSLFRLGQLYEARDRPARAAEMYNRLLTEFPNSLLAPDARTRLRTLRTRS